MKKLLVVVCGLGLALSLLVSPAQASKKLTGAAPDFTLRAASGPNVRLQELRGEVVMINFWASWCGPCRQEMPILNDLYKRYKRAGFTVLGVNVDADTRDAERYLREVTVSFPVLYDTESKVSKLFDVAAMPTTVMVDRNGNMRYLHRGYKPGYEDDYRAQIKELIRE